MEYILIGIVGTFIWIGFEYWRAPMMDEQTGKIIKKGKTFKDLFKRK